MHMGDRFVGIDVGAETIKLAELVRRGTTLVWSRRAIAEHHKEPGPMLLRLLRRWNWEEVTGAAVSGRLGRLVALPRVPTKQAQAAGFRFHHGEPAATVVSIGSHGFSVLELRPSGVEVFRENSRCSQGTGNFLRQLVGRFDLSLEQASALSEEVEDPAPLSGRCPVILKTDMTHLANNGTSRPRILAGLYDAVCENVQVLVKPNISPPKVLLIGGVSRSRRVRAHFAAFLDRNRMELLPPSGDDALYLEAVGSATIAAERSHEVPTLERLLEPPVHAHLERVPALTAHLPLVQRMRAPDVEPESGDDFDLVLGFDIGSTGSKLVALDRETERAVWEGYVSTNGDPVGAARSLMRRFAEGPAADWPVRSVGATGSGREIVGSLLATCYGSERVYVLTEIAAHAEGALHWDPRVDTIFEIGGQDAKYIRLVEGRVVDAAMNEACSAGTGSFIEEQGGKFSGIESVVQLGEEAVRASSGVSLGQHCSVFMAEVIDEAVAAGVDTPSVIAGIYHSIVQNYLNRVKGSRSVGQVVFCQGMPFASDALAAAVAGETGNQVIIPPNPGTVGALGIALLTKEAISTNVGAPIDPSRFLTSEVLQKDTFVCGATQGCGGPGNRCRIDRISTRVDGERERFTWGGNCSLWDRGTGKRKLPDRAPDPFREREAMIGEIVEELEQRPGGRRVALTDEFQLKELFPFFSTFLSELDFQVVHTRSAGRTNLKRGIEEANLAFCAPMQLYHGIVSAMADERPDHIFVPMLREMPRPGRVDHAVACPIVQASPDLMRWDLGPEFGEKVLTPVIDFGEGNLWSEAFRESCRRMAASLGVNGSKWQRAFRCAAAVQERFGDRCLDIGRRTLSFCQKHDVTPVVVLGRPYTIYNGILNSNVPPLLREQGAIAVPVDCYPLDEDVQIFERVYWGHGQRNLRAADQVRRTPGHYSIWCSNYACGPDSFNLHFYAYVMQGKPFAIVETDGHSGDAGTKTRVEAFLHCVREDLGGKVERRRPNQLGLIASNGHGPSEIRARDELVLISRMGPASETLAASLRGIGIRAECLPMPDRAALKCGRRHTSGKECVPMCITLGSLLRRIEGERDSDERFAFLIPTANGPCRFGVYNMLYKIVLEQLQWKDRVSIWSPVDSDYFEGLPGGFTPLVMTGVAASDVLLDALYDVRPVEKTPGATEAVYRRSMKALLRLLEEADGGVSSMSSSLLQVANGRLFGCTKLLRDAAAEFAAIKDERALPTVLVVGEIYVRQEPFTNDFVADKLERRGIRVRLAPIGEWIEYADRQSRVRGERTGFGAQLTTYVKRRILNRTHQVMAEALAWPPRATTRDTLQAARPYVRDELAGEAVLTVGAAVHEWRAGHIDGVVSVGPLECMPNKIAEAQFFHVAENEGLATLTIPVNGEPLDPEIIDGFVFDVKARFRECAR
jgi:predicted CoA-substrate-specific enzyme activase